MSATSLSSALSEYERVTHQLNLFIEQNTQLIDDYNQMLLARNAAITSLKDEILQAAEASKKTNWAYGPYKMNTPRKLDPYALSAICTAGNRDRFIKQTPSVITAEFDRACSNGEFDDAVIDTVVDMGSPRLTGPKLVQIYVCT